jgi:hypothetical protein
MLPLTLLAIGLGVVSAEERGDTPSADAIVREALERAEWNEENRPEADFSYGLLSTLDELDGEGGVEERSVKRYRLDLVEGYPFLRLLEVDGRPLAGEDVARERKRELEFRASLKLREQQGQEPEEPEEHEDTIYFDEDLVSRYRAELVGVRPYAEHEAWVLRFEPRPGELPERRRVDRLLNATRGVIWIDTETWEVARLEFELMRTVRFWWFLGVVSEVRGYYERMPVDGVWLPSRGSLSIRGRALFDIIRRDQSAVWSDWARFPEGARRVDKVPRPEDVPSH